MKATIEFDDALYRRVKVEAARRGRTMRDLVADGVRHVLGLPQPKPAALIQHANGPRGRRPVGRCAETACKCDPASPK